MKFISLGLLFAQSICPLVVYSWVVPPANFINEFAIQHQLTSTTIYLPTNIADPCWISWYRKYFSKYVYVVCTLHIINSTVIIDNFMKIHISLDKAKNL